MASAATETEYSPPLAVGTPDSPAILVLKSPVQIAMGHSPTGAATARRFPPAATSRRSTSTWTLAGRQLIRITDSTGLQRSTSLFRRLPIDGTGFSTRERNSQAT